MTKVEDADTVWVAWLIWSIDRARPRTDAYTLLDLAEELREYADGRDEAWNPTATRSFLADAEAFSALLEPGSATLGYCGDILQPLTDLLRQRKRPDLRAQVGTLADALRLNLLEETASLALLHDLRAESGSELPKRARLDALLDLLVQQQISRGWNPFGFLSRMRELLSGEDPFDSNRLSAPMQVRLGEIDRLVVRSAEPMPCVVWLAFEHALLNHFFLDAGALRFFDARVYVPWTKEASGPPFDERDELQQVLKRALDDDFVSDDPESRIVLVRADLGCQMPNGAIETAVGLTSLLTRTAAALGGSGGWLLTGSALLVVNGKVQGIAHHVGGSGPHDTHPYAMGATAEVLEEVGALIGSQLAANAPALLVRALSTYAELQNVIRSERRLVREATSRTVIALQDQVVEAVAGYGQVTGSELNKVLATLWSASQWPGVIAEAVTLALNDAPWELAQLRDRLDRLLIASSEYRRQLRMEPVSEHSSELLELCQNPAIRQFVSTRLRGLRAPEARATIEAEIAAAARLLELRSRRIRNAAVHGNPLNTRAVASVRSYAEQNADDVIDLALRSFTGGKRLEEILADSTDPTIAHGARSSSGP